MHKAVERSESMTIKEYAASRGITYEAARQVIKRHREELGEHASAPGKNQALELDGVAVELLDGWRASSPVVVLAASQSEELERLRRENDALKNQVIALQGQLLQERAGAAALAGRVEALEAAAALPAPEAEAPAPVPWWRRLFG